MLKTLKSLILVAGFLLALPVMADAQTRTVTVKSDTFGDVTVSAPAAEPRAFFAVIAGPDGFAGDLKAETARFVAEGAAVMTITPKEALDKLAAGDETECHYLLGDFEDVSQTAQRALGVQRYHWPVIIGAGDDGGMLAYLSIAQTPFNTTAGAIATGLSDTVASRLPFCPGAPGTAAGTGKFSYKPASDIPSPFALVSAQAPDGFAKDVIAADAGNRSLVVPGEAKARFEAVLATAFEIGAPLLTDLGDLPLVELPAEGTPRALAIFYSGDGGWRDIDKSIADVLVKSGVAVVGIDSLRYFWTAKSPEVLGADLERITTHYTRAWQTNRVVVLGYSFGAGVIPFAYDKVAPAVRDMMQLFVMMGLDPMTSFEISVSGYIGLANSADVDVRPLLATMPASKVMCFYGSEEKQSDETACLAPELAKATLVERPGGHHFDGDYVSIAKILLERIGTMK